MYYLIINQITCKEEKKWHQAEAQGKELAES